MLGRMNRVAETQTPNGIDPEAVSEPDINTPTP